MHDAHLEHILRQIVENHKVCEQSQIQSFLEKEGYSLPQATLSRRLKKMGIVKIGGVYHSIDVPQLGLPKVLGIQASECGFLVLHTPPGAASALAYFLDTKYVQKNGQGGQILGTIAGDDTVLVLVRSVGELQEVRDVLAREFS